MSTPYLTTQLEHVVQAASLAPGVPDTPPWVVVLRSDGFDLRVIVQAPAALDDDAGRQLHLSCGAAVVTARVAARALGLEASAQLLPEPHHPTLLARLRVTGGSPPDDAELALALAVLRRDAGHGGFQDRQLPAPLMADLCRAVRREGAVLRPVRSDERDPLAQVLTAVARANRAAAAGEGPNLVVLCTPADDPAAWLQAGQAAGAVLLRAAAAGLQAQPMGRLTDQPGRRRALARALGLVGVPQLVLRIGYPAQPGTEPARRS